MQPVPRLHARAKDGQLVWQGIDGKKWDAKVRFFDGKDVEVTIRKWQLKRSNQQNSYYWGVVVAMIAEAAGYTPEEAHDALRMQFLEAHGSTGYGRSAAQRN